MLQHKGIAWLASQFDVLLPYTDESSGVFHVSLEVAATRGS